MTMLATGMTMFAAGMTVKLDVIPACEPGSRRRCASHCHLRSGVHFVFTRYCVNIVATSTEISDAATMTSAM